ncbi:RING-H2 finger protein ATL56 [Ananas comosus]|uniref:RING-H2 finger protein ATL56 n=1 Tax=Ananas comosus TaxID=4615 RepID=A0A199VVF9_ANACO|nr:RING-H2 finger protein ATL56 [Ananas comosus]
MDQVGVVSDRQRLRSADQYSRHRLGTIGFTRFADFYPSSSKPHLLLAYPDIYFLSNPSHSYLALVPTEISGDHHAESEGTGAAAELQRQVRAATDCVVCLEEIRAREQCRALPPCDHVFHAACVDRWLVKSSACPICRATV